jgi:integrase
MGVQRFYATPGKIEKYIQHLRGEELAENSIKKYGRDIAALAFFLRGKPVTKEAAVAWKGSIAERLKPASVNSMLAAANGFFEFFGLGIGLKRVKVQRRTFLECERALTAEEYGRLLGAARACGDWRLYFIMQTLCATGMRVGELRFVTVEALKGGAAEAANKGKSRTILVPSQLGRELLGYAARRGIVSGCVFATRGGKPLDRSNIWRSMRRLCEAAGVEAKKVRPHALRSLFARTFYNKTKDIAKLADILGHSDTKTTRSYVMETCAEHRRLIEDLGLVARHANTT